MEIKEDSYKYILLLLQLTEAASEDCGGTEYINAIAKENCRFFSEFSKEYMDEIYKEYTHRLIYFFSQIVIENFSTPIQFIRHLFVFQYK